jgi:hypothetical protein
MNLGYLEPEASDELDYMTLKSKALENPVA